MIKIICDSMSDVPKEIIDKFDIKVLPITVIFDGVEYIDGETITNKEFYEKLRKEPLMPKTSQVTYAQFKEVFEEFDKNGEILYIAGSSSASGTYQSAMIAKNDGYDNVTLFDTQSLSIGSALFVIEACKMAERGYSVEDIVYNLELLRGTENVLFSVDTLEYLKIGGRISSTKAMIGNLLNIKPILGISDGLVSQKSQVRGKKQIYSALINGILEKYNSDLKNRTVILGCGDNQEDLEIIKNTLTSKFDVGNLYCVNIGCGICSHSGPGIIGISCI